VSVKKGDARSGWEQTERNKKGRRKKKERWNQIDGME